MTVLTCAAVRQRLAAYYDDELPLQDRIAVQGHVNDCPGCSLDLQQFVAMGEAVRLTSAPGPADDWNGLQPGVISRMRAEAHESWTAKFSRLFDDLHLVWIGLASTAGTCICAAIVFGMLHFASPERDDSLRAMIAVVSAPSGSDLNPVSLDAFIRVPSIPDDGLVSATLVHSGAEGELALALSAVITREGRISGLEVLANDQNRRQVSELLAGFSRGRLEPARFGTDPVAVNLVWLVEHMTVRPKLRG
jgi:putative zinc finger protein